MKAHNMAPRTDQRLQESRDSILREHASSGPHLCHRGPKTQRNARFWSSLLTQVLRKEACEIVELTGSDY